MIQEEAVPKMKWVTLMGLNLVTFTLDLCASVGFTYIPPLLLKSGIPASTMTITMGLGPIISLFFVPLVGYWSDTCRSSFGRRRPFILGLSLIMLTSLLLIPYSRDIIAVGSSLLILGVVLLDFSSQALMNPCKSLLSDMVILNDSNQEDQAFSIFSAMFSLGGCLGYLITSFDWSATAYGRLMGGTEKAVFVLLAVMFLLFLVTNLILAKEVRYNPPRAVESEILRRMDDSGKLYHSLESSSFRVSTSSRSEKKWSKCRRIPSFFKTKFKEIIKFFCLPRPLLRLFCATLISWMAIMCHDMFYSDFVGQVIYKGEPDVPGPKQDLYDAGVRMASFGMLLHCLAAAIFAAVFYEPLVQRIGQMTIYLIGMISFTLCMLGTVLTTNLWLINTFAAISGIAFSVVTTIPYSLVTTYASKPDLYYSDSGVRGMGQDMAVLDASFYLAQIIPSMFLGFLVEILGTSSVYMIASVIFGVVGCFLSLGIVYPKNELQHRESLSVLVHSGV